MVSTVKDNSNWLMPIQYCRKRSGRPTKFVRSLQRVMLVALSKISLMGGIFPTDDGRRLINAVLTCLKAIVSAMISPYSRNDNSDCSVSTRVITEGGSYSTKQLMVVAYYCPPSSLRRGKIWRERRDHDRKAARPRAEKSESSDKVQ